MKHILLLTTGGTIASTPNIGGMTPKLAAEDIVDMIPELSDICHIDCKNLFNLDSSNIQPEEWKVIACEVYEGLKNHDGIVITHGTDTMAYTASMLSFMLKNLDKPVIFTGSQLPIVASETDAKENLLNSFHAAVLGLHGVYIVFDRKILRGSRAVKVRTMSFNAFESINNPNVGYFEEGKAIINESQLYNVSGPVVLDDSFDPNVFLLKLVPGTHEEFFDHFLKMNYSGLVIEGFGLGGLHNIRRNLVLKIRQLIKNQIPVVVSTQCLYEMSDLSIYEVGCKIADEGIIPAYDMTSEAAVTKLMWALGHTRNLSDISRIMLTDYTGEICITSMNTGTTL